MFAVPKMSDIVVAIIIITTMIMMKVVILTTTRSQRGSRPLVCEVPILLLATGCKIY